MVSKKCERCGCDILKKYPSQLKGIRFCLPCAIKYRGEELDKKITKKCSVCGKEFRVKSSHAHLRKNCSRKCGGVTHSQAISGNKHPRWRDIKAKKGGYRYLTMPTYKWCNKTGKVYEHHYVMQEYLQRKLTTKEIVHHINGNKKDNRLENLQLMTRAEHTKLHYKY